MDKNFILKANLFEHGINVAPEAKKILDSQSDIWLMEDYITCCGVTLHYEDMYITAGVNPNSHYSLVAVDGNLYVTDNKEINIKTEVITPPDYMKGEIILGGKDITVYCNTYTDRLRLQLISGCANACKFCNAKEFKYEFNEIKYLEEALLIGLSQSDVRHVLISSGSAHTRDLGKITEMYEYFGRKYSHLDLDIMLTPRGFTGYNNVEEYEPYLRHLKEIGISGLSVNMELNNKEYLTRFCPEKAAIGQENYLKFIELAVGIFGKDKVRSLLIVGLEPLEETLKGVEKLAKIGCNPVLSPLFPYGEANNEPDAELFINARRESEIICEKYNIQLGPICKPCSHNVL